MGQLLQWYHSLLPQRKVPWQQNSALWQATEKLWIPGPSRTRELPVDALVLKTQVKHNWESSHWLLVTLTTHTLFFLSKKRVFSYIHHVLFGLLVPGIETHPHPSPNILYLIHQHIYKLMHNRDAETAKSKSPKRGNAVLKLATHMLFLLQIQLVLQLVHLERAGLCSEFFAKVHGRLSTFATKTMRKKYKLEMEEKYFNCLKEMLPRDRTLSLCQKDLFWY